MRKLAGALTSVAAVAAFAGGITVAGAGPAQADTLHCVDVLQNTGDYKPKMRSVCAATAKGEHGFRWCESWLREYGANWAAANKACAAALK